MTIEERATAIADSLKICGDSTEYQLVYEAALLHLREACLQHTEMLRDMVRRQDAIIGRQYRELESDLDVLPINEKAPRP